MHKQPSASFFLGGLYWSGCNVRIRLWPRLPHGFHHPLSMVPMFGASAVQFVRGFRGASHESNTSGADVRTTLVHSKSLHIRKIHRNPDLCLAELCTRGLWNRFTRRHANDTFPRFMTRRLARPNTKSGQRPPGVGWGWQLRRRPQKVICGPATLLQPCLPSPATRSGGGWVQMELQLVRYAATHWLWSPLPHAPLPLISNCSLLVVPVQKCALKRAEN